MLYDLEVRSNPGTEYFTPFKTTVEANTNSDAVAMVRRQYPGCQVWVTNSYNAPRGGGSSSSSGGGGGCMPVLGLLFLAFIVGMCAPDDDKKSPSERPQAAPQERVVESYTPATPEPQFRDYASPPPSYCITENFEPC